MKIGDFEITEAYGDKEKHVAIYRSSGEGGDFLAEDLEKVIAKFYEENF